MSQKPELITTVPNAKIVSDKYQEVIQAHQRLNKQIDQMNTKIFFAMERNQGEFLIAYQNHIRKIKLQLNQLKKKADAHQKQMNQHQRANYLERQVILFRQQSLKLYDRLQQKTQQTQFCKTRLKQLQKNFQVIQKQLKQNIKEKRNLQAKLIQAQMKIVKVQQEIKKKDEALRRATYTQSQNTKSVMLNNLNLRLRQQQNLVASKESTPNKTTAQGPRKKSMNYTVNTLNNRDDNQLKNWFLQCIKAIKKDVAQRKNSGQQLNFDYVKDIQDFKMVDKLRLLQKFMENQKLLIWMYEKIFPSRIAQVKEYLSKHNSHETTKKNSIQSEQALQSQIFQQIPPSQKIEIILPKMNDQKNRKSEVRNKIMIKDGRLNISMI